MALLAGCPRAPVQQTIAADPIEALARARAEGQSGPIYAPFSAVVALPDNRFTANGSLVVSPPNRFRIELRGPIGPPQLVIACDGKAANAYLAPKNTYFASDDASAALASVLGVGALDGAAVATSLLLGRVPNLPGTPSVQAGGLAWSRNDGAKVSLALDSATAHLVWAEVTSADGTRQFRADWTAGGFPLALHAEVPALGVSADLNFGEWQPASPTDAAFVLAAPAGAKVMPLVLSAEPEAVPLAPNPGGAPGPE